MVSIYQFFYSLVHHRKEFLRIEKLEDFPFDRNLLSCRNKGVFPDLVLRVSREGGQISGGEMIELKDNKTYSISSFNSTIPSAKKSLSALISSENSKIIKQMRESGEDPFELPERDVYYLIRGRRKESPHLKVCLVHGHFFETVKIEELIKQAFSQVLSEGLSSTDNIPLSEETIEKILSILSRQEYFRKVRDVEQSSVKLRFRIMTEAKAEANILDSERYPQVKDDTLNLIVPFTNVIEKEQTIAKVQGVFGEEFNQLSQTVIKHPFNGNFLLFQIEL